MTDIKCKIHKCRVMCSIKIQMFLCPLSKALNNMEKIFCDKLVVAQVVQKLPAVMEAKILHHH